MATDTPSTSGTLQHQARQVLAGEQFGVLATSADGRLHTSTILFAETSGGEMVHAIRPATLKAHLGSISPQVAFQVDNRAAVAIDRSAFARLSFEGTLRRAGRWDPDWQRYHDAFAAKFPFGAELLRSPEVEIYVLTPRRMRIAVGAGRPADIDLAPPVEPRPAEGDGEAGQA